MPKSKGLSSALDIICVILYNKEDSYKQISFSFRGGKLCYTILNPKTGNSMNF